MSLRVSVKRNLRPSFLEKFHWYWSFKMLIKFGPYLILGPLKIDALKYCSAATDIRIQSLNDCMVYHSMIFTLFWSGPFRWIYSLAQKNKFHYNYFIVNWKVCFNIIEKSKAWYLWAQTFRDCSWFKHDMIAFCKRNIFYLPYSDHVLKMKGKHFCVQIQPK